MNIIIQYKSHIHNSSLYLLLHSEKKSRIIIHITVNLNIFSTQREKKKKRTQKEKKKTRTLDDCIQMQEKSSNLGSGSGSKITRKNLEGAGWIILGFFKCKRGVLLEHRDG